MANSTDPTHCAGTTGALLPVSPYLGLYYHFGMLLGVDDLETGQAYHRGKMRLHNAWLHGQGVVWGLGVELDAGKGGGEIRVKPGLAVDAAGRELHLDGPACLNIAAWVAAHKDDAAFREAARKYDPNVDVPSEGSPTPPAPLPDVVTFDAYVVIKFKACLTRPVPAVASTCAGSETETAFSRVSEIIDIRLLPGEPPPRPRTHHLLRLLFSLDEPETDEDDVILPDDEAVIQKRDAILELPVHERPRAYLAAFQEVAAMDEIKLSPATKDGATLLFPADDDTSIVIAKIPAIQLDRSVYVSGGPVDNAVRPVLVPTTVLQDLLNGPRLGSSDAGGPRVLEAALTPDGAPDVTGVRLTFSGALTASTVNTADNPSAFTVTWFDTTWHQAQNQQATLDGADPSIVNITFDTIAAGWRRIRVVARGTGPTPILSDTLLPLAGAQGGPPASADEGHDYARTFSPPSS